MPRFIKLDENNVVIGIRYGKSPVDGEIQSEAGEIGQIMREDGTFITPEPEPIESVPSLETIQMQTFLNTEYLVCIAEINSL